MKDPDLLDHLDTSLQAKQSSLLFPIEESAKNKLNLVVAKKINL